MFPSMRQPEKDAIFREGYNAGYADGIRARRKQTAQKPAKPTEDGKGPVFRLKSDVRKAKAPRPVCRIHGCEMHPRKVAGCGPAGLVKRYYCPVKGCPSANKRRSPERRTCDLCGEVYYWQPDEEGNDDHVCPRKAQTPSLFNGQSFAGDTGRVEGSAA